MRVRWWTVGIAYISACPDEEATEKARIARAAWNGIHDSCLLNPTSSQDDEEEEEDEGGDIDPWDLRNRQGPGFSSSSAAAAAISDTTIRAKLPDPTALIASAKRADGLTPYHYPPCITVQVSSLPRNVPIEWWSIGIAGTTLSITSPSHALSSPCHPIITPTNTSTHLFSIEIPLDNPQDKDMDKDTRSYLYSRIEHALGGKVVCEHAVLFASVGLDVDLNRDRDTPEGEGEGDQVLAGIQVIPCERIWGADGKRIGGVVVGRWSSVEGSD